jgi:phage gp36-like protein
MAYTTQAAIEAKVPAPVLTDALDDDGDGERDAGLLDQIIANASEAVDALICNRVSCPVEAPPASVRSAALWFAVEEIYARRQKDLPRDFATAIATARKWLEAVRSGAQSLDAAVPTVLQASEGGQPAVPGRVPMPPGNVHY